MRLRAFRLVGRGAARALDRLHVHADVRGALEEDGAVASQDGSPALLAAAGHALQSLVPEAKARSRHVN